MHLSAFAALLDGLVPAAATRLHKNAGSHVWTRCKPKKTQPINFLTCG